MAGRRSIRTEPSRWDTAVRITTARVECAHCGPTIVPFDDVDLVVAHDAIWYQFVCRRCRRANTVRPAPYATDLLVMSGVRIHLVATPREVHEPHPACAWTPADVDAVLSDIAALDPRDRDDAPPPSSHGGHVSPPLPDGSVPTSGPDPDRIDRDPAGP